MYLPQGLVRPLRRVFPCHVLAGTRRIGGTFLHVAVFWPGAPIVRASPLLAFRRNSPSCGHILQVLNSLRLCEWLLRYDHHLLMQPPKGEDGRPGGWTESLCAREATGCQKKDPKKSSQRLLYRPPIPSPQTVAEPRTNHRPTIHQILPKTSDPGTSVRIHPIRPMPGGPPKCGPRWAGDGLKNDPGR